MSKQKELKKYDELLDKLKHDSELLKNEVLERSETPILRNLSQLNVASRRLTRKPLDPSSEYKACRLFAGGGLDASLHKQFLDQIDVKTGYDSREIFHEVDIDKFLNHRYESLVNTAIEESHQLTSHAFRQAYVSRLEEDWEQSKLSILDSLGFDHAVYLPSQSVYSPYDFTPESPLRDFAAVISSWNRARLIEKKVYPLLKNLTKVTNKHFAELGEYFSMLRTILFEHDESDLGARPSNVNLVAGSIRHSENEYFEHMRARTGAQAGQKHHAVIEAYVTVGFLNLPIILCANGIVACILGATRGG
jgi:hypothetical protein